MSVVWEDLKVKYLKASYLIVSVFMFITLLVNQTWAAPQDVRGSDNIAVETFRTDSGTYILWSSGRITNVNDPNTNYGRSYTSVTGASHIKGQASGSPHVAVGAVVEQSGVKILFADGSLRRPNEFPRADQPATPDRLIRGTAYINGGTKGEGFHVEWLPAGMVKVVFDKPFKSPPSVTILTHKSVIAGTRLVLPIRESITNSSFTISLHAWAGNPTEWVQQHQSFDFMAAGE